MQFVCIFLQVCSKFELLTSQGNAATYLKRGGKYLKIANVIKKL